MRKRVSLFIITILSISGLANAQIAREKEQSNLEKFSSKSGTIIEKSFVKIGSLRGVQIEVVFFNDLISGAKASGVKLEYEKVTRIGSDTKTAFLDSDEVDGFIKTVNLLKTKTQTSKPQSYTEIVFASRSGFQSGCYFSDGKWGGFMKLEKFDSNSLVAFPAEELDALLDLLQKSKQRMVFGNTQQ